MSAAEPMTVELRICRIRAILTALPCVARGDDGVGRGGVCDDLELMAQEELGKVVAVLGTEVLDRDC